jgi:hypothetical protein
LNGTDAVSQPSCPTEHKHGEGIQGDVFEDSGPYAPGQCHSERDHREAVVGPADGFHVSERACDLVSRKLQPLGSPFAAGMTGLLLNRRLLWVETRS